MTLQDSCGKEFNSALITTKHYEEGRTVTYPCRYKEHTSLADSSGTQDNTENICYYNLRNPAYDGPDGIFTDFKR